MFETRSDAKANRQEGGKGKLFKKLVIGKLEVMHHLLGVRRGFELSDKFSGFSNPFLPQQTEQMAAWWLPWLAVNICLVHRSKNPSILTLKV